MNELIVKNHMMKPIAVMIAHDNAIFFRSDFILFYLLPTIPHHPERRSSDRVEAFVRLVCLVNGGISCG